MISYIIKRFFQTLALLAILLVFVFFIARVLPGDPALAMVDPENMTIEQIEAIRKQLGLDRPLYEQFVSFITGLMQGDLGESISYKEPVIKVILRAFPHTLQLSIGAMLVTIIIGVPLGMLAAIWRNTPADVSVLIVSLWAAATPSFWLGLMLLLIFSGWLGWFPLMGVGKAGVADCIRHLILPVIALGVNGIGQTCRMTRSCMLEVMDQDYIRTSRSKGLGECVVICKHALRNALIPVITIIGLNMGTMLAGAVMIETVFTRPGLGRLAVGAILSRDYPLIEGTVTVFAIIFVSINLIVDLTYSFIDPRIRCP